MLSLACPRARLPPLFQGDTERLPMERLFPSDEQRCYQQRHRYPLQCSVVVKVSGFQLARLIGRSQIY